MTSTNSSSQRAPQAPPPLPPSRHRSNSFDINPRSIDVPTSSRPSSSRSKGTSSRNRSNSDGVRMMQQRIYEQQQQQHYRGYPVQYNQPYPMPINMPPIGPPSQPYQIPSSSSSQDGIRHTPTTFMEGSQPIYGSFGGMPSHHMSTRPQQPHSPNFSGFNELSSIMGPGRSVRRPPFGHRRSASESAAPRHPALHPNFLPFEGQRQRMGSFASQHSNTAGET